MLCSPCRPYVSVQATQQQQSSRQHVTEKVHPPVPPKRRTTHVQSVLRKLSSAADHGSQMDSRGGRPGRNRNVFKGSVLVSILLETHPRRFQSRAAAVKFAKRLFRESVIKSIFGSKTFEDSAQLYMWQNDDAARRQRAMMTSSDAGTATSQQGRLNQLSSQGGVYESLVRRGGGQDEHGSGYERLDARLIEDVKNKVLNRSEAYNIVTSYNTFFQELQRDFRTEGDRETQRGASHHRQHRQQGLEARQQQHQETPQLQHQQQEPHQQHHQQYSQQQHPARQPFQQLINREAPLQHTPHIKQHIRQQEQARKHHHHHGNPANTPHRSQTYPTTPGTAAFPAHFDPKRESTCSTDSSVDTQTYFRTRDRNSSKNPHMHHANTTSSALSALTPPQIRDHSSIPEERTPPNSVISLTDRTDKDRDRPDMTSSDYEMTSLAPSSSHPPMLPTSNNTSSSPSDMTVVNGGLVLGMGGSDGVGLPVLSSRTPTSALTSIRGWSQEPSNPNPTRWAQEPSNPTSSRWAPEPATSSVTTRWAQEPAAYSYSDNEKQLIEEMKRMKKEHQDTLRTYEGRINKLMAKMHELRNIAEMLENSSTKSSPYGLLPAKATLLNIIASGTKFDEGDRKAPSTGEGDVPPPLPPRPGRGGRIYPNKPIIHTRSRMKALGWNRIILGESGPDVSQNTVWHGMLEPKLDTDEVERLYCSPPEPASDDVTLLDDIYAVRGRPKHQPLAMFDAERSQRVLTEMRNLRCTLADIVAAVTSLDCKHLHQDSFAELLELLNSPRDVDKILHHVKRKGPGHLDTPEFLIFELSKLDHFRERLEFLRFKNKLQINLFEIDQQLRELNTACDELMSNLSLKNVLETILALGNYLNGGSERGQADGFSLDILNKLKDFVDRTRRGNLLELVMRTYCLQYEADLDLGCPTRFRLPEPSNMRHAAQVSFEEIQKALRDLREELSQVRDRLEVLSKRENTNLTITLRVTSENFLTSAVEVLAEEKRYLEETKGHFWKTTAYFLHTRQCAPQEFFQTWATFLHDCKYYWKLAHRNLARDKFERDFTTKCQLSCSSLPGFTNLKNKMIRTVATLQQDQEMRASKAQQLLHINNWIESVGKYTQEMGPDVPKDTYGNTGAGGDPGIAATPGQYDRHQSRHRKDQGQGDRGERSASPKPIGSTPPNVHKPQPITHVSPTTVSSAYSATSFQGNGAGSGNNQYTNGTSYTHQRFQSDAETLEEPYESLSKAAMLMGVIQDSDPSRDSIDGSGKRHSQDSSGKKNPNFSLKSWLKRDQRQRNSTDELASPSGQPPQYQQQQQQQQQPQSAKSPTTPFNKLRNSVVQKFAGSGSTKKSNDPTKPALPVVPPKPPRSHLENEPVPSHHILFNANQQQDSDAEIKRSSQDEVYEARDYQNFFIQSRGPKDRGSAGQDSVPSTLSSVTSREYSPSKYEAVTRGEGGGRHRDRDSSRERPRHASTERVLGHGSTDGGLAPPTEAMHGGTFNGTISEQASPQKESRARNRAPILLGSNLSISDAYPGRGEEEQRQLQLQQQQLLQQQQQLQQQQGLPSNFSQPDPSRDAAQSQYIPCLQPSNVDSKRVKANAVPVYKAKLIPNYENQTKLDPRLEPGIRGQAEPVHQPVSHFAQSSNSSEVYRQELQRKSEMYLPGSYTSPPQPSPLSQSPPQLSQTPHLPTNPRSSSNSAPSARDGAFGPVIPSSPHYDDFQTPARRSASAQNILEKSGYGVNEQRQSQSGSEPSGASHSYLASFGNFGSSMNSPSSKRDDASRGKGQGGHSLRETRDRDKTPDSSTGPSKGISALINRWEKQVAEDPLGPLLDGQDKPPSMTSTPVTRRKNPSAPSERGREKESGTKSATVYPQAFTKPYPSPHTGQGSGGNFNLLAHPATGNVNSSGGSMHKGVNGVSPFGGSLRSQPYPQSQSPQQNTYPTQAQGSYRQHQHTPRSQAYTSPHQQQSYASPHHQQAFTSPLQQQQQSYTPPHQQFNNSPQMHSPYGSNNNHNDNQAVNHHQHNHTNTYPPRSFHTPGRVPNDNGSNLDIADSYIEQLRKASGGGNAGGDMALVTAKPVKPVPLPRQNIPGAMAVVKPTVMHQGALTFMEI